MKTNMVTSLAVLIFITGIHAADQTPPAATNGSYPEAKYQAAINRYAYSLTHKNDGVVSSALINLIKIKIRFPLLDYKSINLKLQSLQHTGRTENIRFLSGICIKCFKHSGNLDFLFDLPPDDSRKLIPQLFGHAL